MNSVLDHRYRAFMAAGMAAVVALPFVAFFEPDVTIDMKREHLGIAGEWRAGAAGSLLGFDRVTGHLNRTLYQHREIEGSGAVGTTFTTSGNEARMEARVNRRARFKSDQPFLVLSTRMHPFDAFCQRTISGPSSAPKR